MDICRRVGVSRGWRGYRLACFVPFGLISVAMTWITVALAVVIAIRLFAYRLSRGPFVVTQGLILALASIAFAVTPYGDELADALRLPAFASFAASITGVMATDRFVVWAHKCVGHANCARHDKYVTVAAVIILGALYVTGSPFESPDLIESSEWRAVAFTAIVFGLEVYRITWLAGRALTMAREAAVGSPRRVTATAFLVACILGLFALVLSVAGFDDEHFPSLADDVTIGIGAAVAVFGGAYPARQLIRAKQLA